MTGKFPYVIERWFIIKNIENLIIFTVLCFVSLSVISYLFGFLQSIFFLIFIYILLVLLELPSLLMWSPKISLLKEGISISNVLYEYKDIKKVTKFSFVVFFVLNNGEVKRYKRYSLLLCSTINIDFDELEKFINDMKYSGESTATPILSESAFNKEIKEMFRFLAIAFSPFIIIGGLISIFVK